MPEPSEILIQNIFHMLCYAFKILRQKNYQDLSAEDFAHVKDLLAAILCRGVNQQLKQGLCRAYISVDEQSSALRGKINLYRTKMLQKRKIRQFVCSHDEFSPDHELNQILKAACRALLRDPEVAGKQKTALRRILPFFSDISDIDLSAVQWNRLQFHRNNRSYEMLMNICYMVWQSLLPSTRQGTVKLSLFDEDSLPLLYERFILEYYRQHFPALRPQSAAIPWDIPADTEPSMIRLLPGMRSDITLRHEGLTLIIDAKFYQRSLVRYMDKEMLRNVNLYQIFAYVKNADKTNSGNVSGLLLYARTTEETEPFLSVVMGGNKIDVRSLDLNRPFPAIAAALDAIAYACFGRTVRRIA